MSTALPLATKPTCLTEIASIFLAHSANYFLSNSGGTVAFVLPRSFMSADQHHNTRVGDVSGIRLTEIWDLRDVHPLFRVPSCVFFAIPESDKRRRLIPAAGLKGLSISGRLPAHHIHYAAATRYLTETSHPWFYSTLGGRKTRGRSAFTEVLIQSSADSNSYATRFKQGATIVPRNFYFLEITQKLDEAADLKNRTVSVRTSALAEEEAKGTWKGKTLSGRVESNLLFRTALARNVVPFALIDPPLVTLPLLVVEADGERQFLLATAEDLLANGYRYASTWFDDAERASIRHRTAKYAKAGMTLQRRLDFQRGATAQSPDARHLVIYTASGTDASAVVIDRTKIDLPFIVDHKTYWCEPRSEEEAHYLAAFLNSGFANQKIKGFQSTGLFGERDIHKTIVKLPLPAFDKRNDGHMQLAYLGREAAKRSHTFASAQGWSELKPHVLGRARVATRRHLADALVDIDVLLTLISQDARPAQKARTKRSKSAGPLFKAS
jgi:hypothetical protein